MDFKKCDNEIFFVFSLNMSDKNLNCDPLTYLLEQN